MYKVLCPAVKTDPDIFCPIGGVGRHIGRVSAEYRLSVGRLSIEYRSSTNRVSAVKWNASPLLALLFAPFFAWSLTLVPLSLLRNRTETLATQDKSCPSYGESNKGSKERQGPTLGVRQFTDSLRSWRYCVGARSMHQSIPPAPSPLPPGLLRGICPPCQSRRWGICKFCKPRVPGQKSFGGGAVIQKSFSRLTPLVTASTPNLTRLLHNTAG